jgi:dienelactone hydrolase
VKFFNAILTSMIASSAVHAAIKTETVEYKQGSTVLEGYLAYDETAKGKRPGVVIVHEWMGLNDYTKRRAREMAELGYVALAADIYGKGVRAKDAKEAGELAGKFKADRKLLRARAQAAYDYLSKQPRVDGKKMLAMGYCFGGTTVLEMALSGLPLAGVASFHGGLDFSNPADAKNIKAKLLIMHGAIDPFVPADQVAAFQKELNDAKVDYQFIAYSNAVHGFTNPDNGQDNSKGAAYNALADKRSFDEMKRFFSEVTQ